MSLDELKTELENALDLGNKIAGLENDFQSKEKVHNQEMEVMNKNWMTEKRTMTNHIDELQDELETIKKALNDEKVLLKQRETDFNNKHDIEVRKHRTEITNIRTQIENLKRDHPHYKSPEQIESLKNQLRSTNDNVSNISSSSFSKAQCPNCSQIAARCFVCHECRQWICQRCKGLEKCFNCGLDFKTKSVRRSLALEKYILE